MCIGSWNTKMFRKGLYALLLHCSISFLLPPLFHQDNCSSPLSRLVHTILAQEVNKQSHAQPPKNDSKKLFPSWTMIISTRSIISLSSFLFRDISLESQLCVLYVHCAHKKIWWKCSIFQQNGEYFVLRYSKVEQCNLSDVLIRGLVDWEKGEMDAIIDCSMLCCTVTLCTVLKTLLFYESYNNILTQNGSLFSNV